MAAPGNASTVTNTSCILSGEEASCGSSNWTVTDPDGMQTVYGWYQSMASRLGLALLPVILALGLTGNSLALAVLQGNTYRKSSSGFLLTCLALCDTLSLLTGLLRKWINMLSSGVLDLRLISGVGCVVHFFLTYVCQAMGSWTLVVFTVERTVAVYLPVHTRQWCSRRRIMALWFAVLAVVGGFYSHLLFIVNINHYIDYPSTPVCHIKVQYRIWDYDVIFARVDLALMATVPCCVITLANLLIIARLCRARKQRALVLTGSGAPNAVGSARKPVTAILILVSAAFLFMIVPYALFYALYTLFDATTAEQRGRLLLAETCITLLYYTNNAVNFLLYCLSGATFRAEFADVICRIRMLPPTASAVRTSSSSTRLSSMDLKTLLLLSGEQKPDRRQTLSPTSANSAAVTMETWADNH